MKCPKGTDYKVYAYGTTTKVDFVVVRFLCGCEKEAHILTEFVEMKEL